MAKFLRGLSPLNIRSFDKLRMTGGLSPLYKGFLAAAFWCLFNCAFCFGSDIRFHLWAQLDAYPESEEAQDISSGQFDYPISMMKETAPFLVNGMVYGWNFVYTPSDKARGVEEYFELTPIQEEKVVLEGVTYEEPWISEENNRLNCWVCFSRNQFQTRNFNLWSSIKNPVIHGRGTGKIEKGFEGINDAARDAVKNAVREHFRNEIKNKPKEISGSVLIRKNPTLGIVAGQYVINLDFFLESGTIITYSVF